MSIGMNRRHFLKVSGATALALTTVGSGIVKAANTANYWTYGFDEETHGEETLVKKAIGIAVTRMQEVGIRRNAYDVAKNYAITGEVMENSNLTNNDENKWNLLWHQLHWLSQPNGTNDKEPAFPNIRIRGIYDPVGKPHWVGKANYNKVIIRSVNGEVTQSGEFDVTLNRHFLGQPGVYSEPEEWASTLVHEMLHNLGHVHSGVANADVSSDVYQINAMNNAVLCGGYYKNPKYRWRSASHLCGGRV